MVYYILKQSPFPDIILLFKLKQEVSEAGSASIFWCGRGDHMVGHIGKNYSHFPAPDDRRTASIPKCYILVVSRRWISPRKRLFRNVMKDRHSPRVRNFTKDLGGLRS